MAVRQWRDRHVMTPNPTSIITAPKPKATCRLTASPMEPITILVAIVVAAGSAKTLFRSGDRAEPMLVRLFSLVTLAVSLGAIWFVVHNQGHAMEALKSWLDPMLGGSR